MEKPDGDPIAESSITPELLSTPPTTFLIHSAPSESGTSISSNPTKLPKSGIINNISFFTSHSTKTEFDFCLFTHPKPHPNFNDLFSARPVCDLLKSADDKPLLFVVFDSCSLRFPHLYIPVLFEDDYLHLSVNSYDTSYTSITAFLDIFTHQKLVDPSAIG